MRTERIGQLRDSFVQDLRAGVRTVTEDYVTEDLSEEERQELLEQLSECRAAYEGRVRATAEAGDFDVAWARFSSKLDAEEHSRSVRWDTLWQTVEGACSALFGRPWLLSAAAGTLVVVMSVAVFTADPTLLGWRKEVLFEWTDEAGAVFRVSGRGQGVLQMQRHRSPSADAQASDAWVAVEQSFDRDSIYSVGRGSHRRKDVARRQAQADAYGHMLEAVERLLDSFLTPAGDQSSEGIETPQALSGLSVPEVAIEALRGFELATLNEDTALRRNVVHAVWRLSLFDIAAAIEASPGLRASLRATVLVDSDYAAFQQRVAAISERETVSDDTP